jgi:hypothetical protein
VLIDIVAVIVGVLWVVSFSRSRMCAIVASAADVAGLLVAGTVVLPQKVLAEVASKVAPH